MKKNLVFARSFFFVLSILFLTTYAVSTSSNQELTAVTGTIGVALGAVFALFLMGLDSLFRKSNLRALSTTMLGLLLGYLLGTAVLKIFSTIVELSGLQAEPATLRLFAIATYLAAIYLSVVMTIRAADELSISLPFVQLKPQADRKKDLLLDLSALQDVRLIDLANSGLIDNHLVVSRPAVKALYSSLETSDESESNKSRRALETLKKLEAMPDLNLRYDETDLTDVKDQNDRLVRLARLLDAYVLTADHSRIQSSTTEGVRFVNLNALAHALKPITQAGEFLNVKIQRHGKEPRQGVGYLEDGTMVVINGGGDFLGQTIRTQVLSVKHTSSGRMIFCNACDEPSEAKEPELVGSSS